MISKDLLPEKICLEDYGGDYKAYIDAIYEVSRVISLGIKQVLAYINFP